MSLQVNLILDSEARSGSTISLKFMIRILAVGVPVLLGLAIAGLILAGRSAKQGLIFAEQEKKDVTPVFNSVIKMKQELKEARQIVDALEGWGLSRADWHFLLRRLQAVVPPSIQLLRMNVNETIGPADNISARLAVLYIKGKVLGDSAEDDVRVMVKALQTGPDFTNYFAKVNVQRFEASESATEKNARIFDLECILAPRKIASPKATP